MAANPTAQSLLQDVVTALGSLPDFPGSGYMNRLYNMTRWSGSISPFTPKLDIADSFGPNPSQPFIDNVDVTEKIKQLGVQSIVAAIGALDAAQDKPNFRATVNAVSSYDSQSMRRTDEAMFLRESLHQLRLLRCLSSQHSSLPSTSMAI